MRSFDGLFASALREKDEEIERLQAEHAEMRAYMSEHAPLQLRGFDIRNAKPDWEDE